MIAYNKNWLYNLFVKEQAAEAFHKGLISREEVNNINSSYPVGFYTPNFFIRVGLFVLTILIAIFSSGLISLFMMSAMERSITAMIIFFGMLSYAASEMMVRSKHHYRSGVDDALSWMAAVLVFGGIVYGVDASPLGMCCIAFIIAGYFTVRFTDRLMSLVTFLSLVGILFFTCNEIGTVTKALAPFVLMAANMVIYFVARRLKRSGVFFHYLQCLSIVEVASLLCFFAAGNYFVVRELSIVMFDLTLPEGASIPYGKLFWAFTILTPLSYLFFGIKTKNRILVRCGLLVAAIMILTVRYYYDFAAVETIMTLGGILLIAGSYLLIRYLKTPKNGYTYLELAELNKAGAVQVESLVITETFSETEIINPGTQFGGGSFGGGGAGSNF